ncbi:MAG TPA: chromate transporter [Dongiaceae bacterium]|jgi:chromate transporter
MDGNILSQLAGVFAPLSLLSLGGGQSVLSAINRQVVEVHGWMTQQDFVDLFAISRAAPGPGSLLSTLIGWRVAGTWGVVAASMAYFIPSSTIAYFAARTWNRYKGNAWQAALERGLAPVATGLILSGAFSVLQASSGAISLLAITAVATVIFILRPKLNPVPVLFAAGIVQVVVQIVF